MPDHRFLKDSVASPLLGLLQAEAAATSCLRDARVLAASAGSTAQGCGASHPHSLSLCLPR